MVNVPVPFEGTDEERNRNFRTHAFYGERCDNCDCRPFGRYADYPCGAPVPRMNVEPAQATYLAIGAALMVEG